MISVGVVAGLWVYGVVVAVLSATEGVLPKAAHGAVDALEYGLALVVGQASVPHVAEGFADDVGVEVVHLLGALPVVGGPSAGLPLGQHGVDGQTAVAVADVGDDVVAVHHVVLLLAGAASQVELVLHRCWLFLIVVSPVKGLVGWREGGSFSVYIGHGCVVMYQVLSDISD